MRSANQPSDGIALRCAPGKPSTATCVHTDEAHRINGNRDSARGSWAAVVPWWRGIRFHASADMHVHSHGSAIPTMKAQSPHIVAESHLGNSIGGEDGRE